jgi:hypothetical protein
MASSGARAAETRAAADYTDRGRTPAQWYCLLAGLTLLLAGVLGFIVNSDFDTGSNVQGDELVVLEVNGIHNLVHLASGLVLLASAGKRAIAKTVAIAFGLVYGVVTIIGLIDGETVLGLLPVNAADNVLHIALSVLGLIAGFISPAGDRVRAR